MGMAATDRLPDAAGIWLFQRQVNDSDPRRDVGRSPVLLSRAVAGQCGAYERALSLVRKSLHTFGEELAACHLAAVRVQIPESVGGTRRMLPFVTEDAI